MSGSKPALTVAELFKTRDAAAARRHAEEEAEAAQKAVHLWHYTQKVLAYQITEEDKANALAKIRRAFDAGETEVMLVHFPSDICADRGRRIHNRLEGWQDTLPGYLKRVHEWWQTELEPGGFIFGARVIDYIDGVPGDIGLFISWPETHE